VTQAAVPDSEATCLVHAAELLAAHLADHQLPPRQLLHRETKTATSDATLPLPDICAAALQLRKVKEAHARELAGAAWQGGKLIFATKWGTPIEPRNFNRSWDARCTKAGVRKITVHDGRRTCATGLSSCWGVVRGRPRYGRNV
jgi:integrase